MNLRSRIFLEALGLSVLLALTFFGYGWMLHVHLGIQLAGVVMLLAPVAFGVLISAAYGLYIGWERRFGTASQVPVRKILRDGLSLVGYSLLLLLLVGGALYLYWRGAKGLALLVAVPAGWALITLWRTVQNQLERSQSSVDQVDVIYRPVDRFFEHRFRIVVFAALLFLTWTCVLILIAVGSIESGVVLLLVGLVASPWLIRKVREDRQQLRTRG